MINFYWPESFIVGVAIFVVIIILREIGILKNETPLAQIASSRGLFCLYYN